MQDIMVRVPRVVKMTPVAFDGDMVVEELGQTFIPGSVNKLS